ncbi:MAG: DNA ligase D [Chloroflexota bacterium]|nr:DNA ligase D [Chloroflexota bacterium]
MLATAADRPFDDPAFRFEVKWDGFRALARCEGSRVRLVSRSGQDLGHRFAAVVEELAERNLTAWLDGELVAVDDAGRPSFQALQRSLLPPGPARAVPGVAYVVFDCAWWDGARISDRPLSERLVTLERGVPDGGPVQRARGVVADGTAFYEAVVASGMEGVVAKRLSSPYVAGRSSAWLKIRAERHAELVIIGFTNPRGTRSELGALLVGYYDDAVLRYGGHVGTGFDVAELRRLRRVLDPLQRKVAALAGPVPKTNAPATWVEPTVVAEVRFREWTADRVLRQPVYVGLRPDRRPEECLGPAEPVARVADADAHNPPVRDPPTPSVPRPVDRKADALRIGRRSVKVTNWDKVLFPDDGITKGDLIEYYLSVAPRLLPFVVGRLVSLERYPNGIRGHAFYQKDAPDGLPSWIPVTPLPTQSRGGSLTRYISLEEPAALAYVANLGSIPIHAWLSRRDRPELPDMIAWDLDPSPTTRFEEVVALALLIRELLAGIALEPFVKTTGGDGLHLVVPIRRGPSFEAAKEFTGRVAVEAARLMPDAATVERTIARRGGRIYIDYLQNNEGQTLVPPLSVRPRPGAPVAMPLEWAAVTPRLNPRAFHLRNVPALAAPTPWNGFFEASARRSLPQLAGAWERLHGSSPVPPMSRFRGPYR